MHLKHRFVGSFALSIVTLTACAHRSENTDPSASVESASTSPTITCSALVGAASAAAALQACIDAAPDGATLVLPRGTFELRAPVYVGTNARPRKDLTVTSEGTGPCSVYPDVFTSNCATLRAAPSFKNRDGLFYVHGSGIRVTRLILDGNAPLRSPAVAGCSEDKTFGFSFRADQCASCSLTDSVIMRTPCAAAVGWTGGNTGSKILDNYVVDAGAFDTFDSADGISVHQMDDGAIERNVVRDSTDVGIIVGRGRNLTIRDNRVFQTHAAVQAGLMIDNFGGDLASPQGWGDFTGADVSGNVLDGGPSRFLMFGMLIGPYAFNIRNTSGVVSRVVGAKIHHNHVNAARVGFAVDGAGTVDNPVHVWANTVLGDPSARTPVHVFPYRSGDDVSNCGFGAPIGASCTALAGCSVGTLPVQAFTKHSADSTLGTAFGVQTEWVEAAWDCLRPWTH